MTAAKIMQSSPADLYPMDCRFLWGKYIHSRYPRIPQSMCIKWEL